MTNSPVDPILMGFGPKEDVQPVSSSDPLPVGVSSITAPTTAKHEQLSVGTSAVQLSANALQAGVTLKADDDNTNSVYIGVSGVLTTTGYRLKAGQAVFVSIDNANRLYAIGGAASQKLHVLGS